MEWLRGLLGVRSFQTRQGGVGASHARPHPGTRRGGWQAGAGHGVGRRGQAHSAVGLHTRAGTQGQFHDSKPVQTT